MWERQVVDGMETVQALAALPSVKDNTSSGYVQYVLCFSLTRPVAESQLRMRPLL